MGAPFFVADVIKMPVITLPDGSQKHFDRPVTIDEVAGSIGAGLRRAALAGRVDGKVVDTSFVVGGDARVSIVTDRDPEGLEVIRHSTAHLLAQAVKQLFPEAQVTIGPVIEDGFYYDFAFKRPFTPEDLAAIEARMHEIANADLKVSRTVMARDEAVRVLSQARRELQGGDHRFDSRQRRNQPVRTGRFRRPVPRPSRAEHRQAQGIQADEGRGRVLAWRFAQRDAAADLRYRLGRREIAQGLLDYGWKRRRSATTAASARNRTCFISRRRRRVPCSGIRKAGPFFRH